MKTQPKEQNVKIASITIDRNQNFRLTDENTYNTESLELDISTRGQTDPVSLKRVGDLLIPIRGFRRVTAIQRLADRGVTDPNTGKPFENVRARIYENLTPQEEYVLKADHSQRRGLNAAELFNSLGFGFDAGMTEEQVVNINRDLLEMHNPPKRQIENTPKAYLEYYRKVVQIAKKAWNGPRIMREAWRNKLAGLQTWPRQSELEHLFDVYVKERDDKEIPTNKLTINPENPGPKFMAEWNAMINKREEAEAKGVKAKSIAGRNRQQIDEMHDKCTSLILKMALAWVQSRIGPDRMILLNQHVSEIEQGKATFNREYVVNLLSDGNKEEESEESSGEAEAA